MRILAPTLISFVSLLFWAGPAKAEEHSVADLFRGSQGIRVQIQIDLPEAGMTPEEAGVYCRQKLIVMGIPVRKDAPAESMGKDVPLRDLGVEKVPDLRIFLGGGSIPASDSARDRGVITWYQSRTIIQYRDFVIYKRNPKVERLMPVLYHRAGGTFFSQDEFQRFVTSRRGIEQSLDAALDRFRRALLGEWTFDPFDASQTP